MELTTVVGTVGGIIAAASSISAVAALFDTRQRARLADAQLALEVQRAATEREVIEMLLRAADWRVIGIETRHRLRAAMLRFAPDAPLARPARSQAPSGPPGEHVQPWQGTAGPGLESERGGARPQDVDSRIAGSTRRGDCGGEGGQRDPSEGASSTGACSASLLSLKVARPRTPPTPTRAHAAPRRCSTGSRSWRSGIDLSEKKATTAYVPFGLKDSSRPLLLLTPRSLHVNARFRVPQSTDVDGLDVTNYSKDGFYSIRVSQTDLDERGEARRPARPPCCPDLPCDVGRSPTCAHGPGS